VTTALDNSVVCFYTVGVAVFNKLGKNCYCSTYCTYMVASSRELFLL